MAPVSLENDGPFGRPRLRTAGNEGPDLHCMNTHATGTLCCRRVHAHAGRCMTVKHVRAACVPSSLSSAVSFEFFVLCFFLPGRTDLHANEPEHEDLQFAAGTLQTSLKFHFP